MPAVVLVDRVVVLMLTVDKTATLHTPPCQIREQSTAAAVHGQGVREHKHIIRRARARIVHIPLYSV